MHTIKHTMQEWPANASGVEASPSAGQPPVWSHRCGWEELAVPFAVDSAARAGLDLGPGWVAGDVLDYLAGHVQRIGQERPQEPNRSELERKAQPVVGPPALLQQRSVVIV